MKIARIVAAAALALNVGQAFAAQGDVVTAGSIDPSGNLTASFVDSSSGFIYHFFVEGIQNSAQTNGDTTIGVRGNGVRACSVHGPSVQFDPSGGAFNYGGNNPLGSVQCGTSYGETVKIDGCVALIQAHGFSHSDDPNVNYLGPVTIDVRYMRKPGNPAADQVEINIYTPKEPIKLSGKVTGGAVSMPGCTR